MAKKIIKALKILLLLLGGAFFDYWIIRQGLAPENTIPTVITHFVTGLGAVLATNFGAVFGIQVGSGLLGRIGRFVPGRATYEGDDPVGDWIRLGAVGVYLVGLIAAFGFWWKMGFTNTAPALLQSMGSTFLGIVVAIFAASLGTTPPRRRSVDAG